MHFRPLVFLVSSAGQVLLQTLGFRALTAVPQNCSGDAVGVVGADQGLASNFCKRCLGLRRMEARSAQESTKRIMARVVQDRSRRKLGMDYLDGFCRIFRNFEKVFTVFQESRGMDLRNLSPQLRKNLLPI